VPRLRNYDYIKRRILLSKVWDTAFTQLNRRDQLNLHSYYCPTLALTNDELITYRQTVSRRNRRCLPVPARPLPFCSPTCTTPRSPSRRGSVRGESHLLGALIGRKASSGPFKGVGLLHSVVQAGLRKQRGRPEAGSGLSSSLASSMARRRNSGG
jgi:hypothetical protein